MIHVVLVKMRIWNKMGKREKNQALEFVLPESRNHFILRPEPSFRSWRLVKIEPQPEGDGLPSAAVGLPAAAVTVSIDRMVQAVPISFSEVTIVDLWVFDGQSWKVKVRKPGQAIQQIFGSPATEEPLPALLQVLPKLLKIHFLSQIQLGSIVIRNGLETSAQLVSLEYDPARFEVVEKPSRVKAGETAKIVIKYRGDEVEKDLRSEVRLVLEQGGEEKVFPIPVLYNYLSPGARGLFGLTEEKARKLKRGDKVTPVIKLPPKEKKEPAPTQP